MFKKITAIALCLVLVLSLTACDSLDYKEAMGLYEDGAYEEAKAMFLELGDYEDSADMVDACDYEIALELLEDGEFDEAAAIFEELGDYEDCEELLAQIPFMKVVAWLKEEGTQVYTGPEEYTVELSAEGENIIASYIFDKSSDGMQLYINFTLTLVPGETVVQLDTEGKMVLMGGKIHDIGEATLDIASYTAGYEVTDWDSLEITGNKVDGSPLDSDASGVAALVSDVSLERLAAGMVILLDDSGLGVTVADLGFASYK